MGFERVTSVRTSVTKRLNFRALVRVRAPSPRLLYSVGDWSMIQLNDSESLVSVQQVFSDHRARASWRHTNEDTLFWLQKSALWVWEFFRFCLISLHFVPFLPKIEDISELYRAILLKIAGDEAYVL